MADSWRYHTWPEEDDPKWGQARDVAAQMNDIKVLAIAEQHAHNGYKYNNHGRVDAVDFPDRSIASIRPAHPNQAK